VVSTLMESGLAIDEGNSKHLEIIAQYLEQHFNNQDGIIGFGMN
jgi:hypothetical protein